MGDELQRQFRREADSTLGKFRIVFEVFNKYGLPPILVIVGILAWFGIINSPFTEMSEAIKNQVKIGKEQGESLISIRSDMIHQTWLLHKIRCEHKDGEKAQLECFKENINQ